MFYQQAKSILNFLAIVVKFDLKACYKFDFFDFYAISDAEMKFKSIKNGVKIF